MKSGKLVAAYILFCATSSFGWAAQLEDSYEETLQYALENIQSGGSTASLIAGVEITISPIRTWKSVSGHYCREYEMTISKPDAEPTHDQGTRCRAKGGGWKQPKDN